VAGENVPGLTNDEIETFRQSGIVVPRLRLPRERIDQLRATLDRLIAENPGIRPERLVSAHIEGRNSEGVRGSREFLDLARDPAILDLVEDVIGPDIVLWGCQIFCKPGGDGLEVPWHQDGHYWPMRPLATVTVWIALDSSTAENGCLRVIPGSHRDRRLFEHMREDRTDLVLTEKVQAQYFDADTALDIELEPGRMSIHDVYLIHGSNSNRSPKRRAGVAIRYMPASSFFDRNQRPPGALAGYLVDFTTRPIWLVRGIDLSGRNDFTVGHVPKEMVAAPNIA
jgi:ectoine hydroxylase-related dioxygenase (phytanoyl-CoA dioxygenase family)